MALVEPDGYELVDDFRLLIADLDEKNQIFSDTQIQAFLRLAEGNLKRAAARSLRTIAASEVLLSKKITSQDLSTDGPAVAAELRAQAQQLEEEAAEKIVAEEMQDPYASFVTYGHGGGRVEGEEHAYTW